jgi:hypothetical protein
VQDAGRKSDSAILRSISNGTVAPVPSLIGGRKEEEVRSTYRQIYGFFATGDENAARRVEKANRVP